MKERVIRMASFLGILLSLAVMSACTPAGQAVGRGLMIQAIGAGLNRAAENTVDENTVHRAQCPYCYNTVQWHGHARQVGCWNCKRNFLVNP